LPDSRDLRGRQTEVEDQMYVISPFPATVLRPPSPDATCTCEHYAFCDHACHHRTCDPTENACDIDFLPDEGGLTRWGCADCTPGGGIPHVLGCELIGWSVPARIDLSA
jgi:hypothetical protein